MNRTTEVADGSQYALRLLRLAVLLQERFRTAQRETHPDGRYDDSTAAMQGRLQRFAVQIGKRPSLLLNAYRKFCGSRLTPLPQALQDRLTDCCSRIELFVAALNPDQFDLAFLLDAQVLFDPSIDALPLEKIGLSDAFYAAA